MRSILVFLILISAGHKMEAQPGPRFPARIYIVRHAEKETGSDPVLTTAGRQRAGDLMRRLRHEHIQAAYVTQYLRTQMTADSLRIQLYTDTLHYVADTVCDDLLNRISLHDYSGQAILIVGHSNTIPKIIRKLGVSGYPQANIPDAEFDNLFLLRYKKHRAWLKRSKYGASSQPSATMH